MKIELNKEHKVTLLKALKAGILDTDTIPELKAFLALHEPARVLSRAEAKELMNELEKEY